MRLGKKILIMVVTILLGGGLLCSNVPIDYTIHAEDALPVEYNGTAYATIDDAVAAVPAGSEATIYLTDDLDLKSWVEIRDNKTITLLPKDKNVTLSKSHSKAFFRLGTGKLSIGGSKNTITIDGKNTTNALLTITVSDNVLTLNENVIIQNFNGTVISYPAYAPSNHFEFNLNGAVIQNCTSASSLISVSSSCIFNMISGSITNNNAPILQLDGQFNMQGGEISNNTSTTPIINSDGFKGFTMSGGKIANNKVNVASANYAMGTIRLQGSTENQSMIMSGGEISDNYSNIDGGGLYLLGYTTFEMTGGSIVRNTAENNGGGILIAQTIKDKNIKLTMSGGTISENKAIKGSGGGVFASFKDAEKSVKLKITGGSINDNNAKSYGGGIYIASMDSVPEPSQLIVSDRPVIKNNTAISSGNNIYLGANSFIMIDGVLNDTAQMSVNSNITEGGMIASSIAPYGMTKNDLSHIEYENPDFRIELFGTSGILGKETRETLTADNLSGTLYTGQNYSGTHIITKINDSKGNEVKGVWEFLEDSKATTPGTQEVMVKFVPEADDLYKPLESKLTITIKKAEYSVEHYFEDAAGDYQLNTTEKQAGDIGETVTAIAVKETGYHLNTSHSDTISSGTIEMDGTNLKELKLKLYYDLDEYIIQYKDDEKLLSEQTHKYNDKLSKPKSPIKDGYNFIGWYKDKAFNEAWDFEKDVITKDVTLYAKWIKLGQITTDIDKDGESSNMQIDMTEDELIDAVLTQEQKDYINKGTDIELTVKIMPTELNEATDKLLKENLKDYAIGQTLDISVWLKINDQLSQVSQTKKPIKIKIEIPEELRKIGTEFVLVRIHNGQMTILEDLDTDEKTITLLSDQFSNYVLMYKDKEKNDPIQPVPPVDEPGKTPSNPDSVDTGASLDIGMYFAMLITTGGILALILLEKQKKRVNN